MNKRRGRVLPVSMEHAQVANMEKYLGYTLHPVQPRPAFVSGLKSRLMKASEAKKANRAVIETVLLTLVGVAGSAVLVIAGVRSVVTLIGALGVVKLLREQSQNKRSPLIH